MLRKLIGVVVVLVILVGAAGAYVWTRIRLPVVLEVPEQGAVLDGVTIINPGHAPEPGRRIVIEGGRIASIEAAPADAGGPWAGAFVLPGLTDMHVHLPVEMYLRQAELFGVLFLGHGVTTVRDAGSVDGASLDYRERVRQGEFAGPRIYACGPFVDGDPPLWPNSKVARTPEEGRAVVDELAAMGVDCIKAYTRLDAPTLAAIREAAHAKGLPVIGHVPARVPYEEALLDDAQHLIGAAGLPPEGAKTMAENLAPWRAMDKEQYALIARTALKHDLANTPTLVALDQLSTVENYAFARGGRPGRLLPRYFRDVIWNPKIGLPLLRTLREEDYAAMRETRAARFKMVRILSAAGARLHLGTDVQIPFVVPGESMQREMKLFLEAGVPLEEVWVYATRGAAKALNVPDHGELRAGAAADLLVFKQDPTKSLSAFETLEAVVAQGRLYPMDKLRKGMEQYLAHYEDPWFDQITQRLTELALQRMFADR
jgi:imidazolonepropionase-like amidohydrolase